MRKFHLLLIMALLAMMLVIGCDAEGSDSKDDFRFQLTDEEAKLCSRWKKFTLNSTRGSNIKYNPYAFTEQGIYMLMTVLRGDLAVKQSKALIRLFKQMKDYIVESQNLITNKAILALSMQITQNTKDIAEIKSEMVTKNELAQVIHDFTDPKTRKEYLNYEL